jgi:hypothetical protein
VFIRNRLNFRNYSNQDAAVIYLGENKINRLNVLRSTFELEAAVKVRNVSANSTAVLPESIDIDYFGVLYARNGTANQINVFDSTFRQALP